MTKPILYAAGLVLAASLAACTEAPQTLTAGKGGAPAVDGTGTPYMVPGWKPGDKASWDEQMRSRTHRGQNEYSRAAPGN